MNRFLETILSEYGNSPTIGSLINSFHEWIDPKADLDAFYDCIWNIDTATGVGLDIWGRIVGIGRVLSVASGIYFGFAEAADPSDMSPLNSGGPFFSGGATTGNYALSDDVFRLLIFAKALANISDGSIPALNEILLTLFPGRGNIFVTDGGNMTMTVTVRFSPTPVETALIAETALFMKPEGVVMSIVYLPGRFVFGRPNGAFGVSPF